MKWHSRLLRSLREASAAALDDSDEAVDQMFDSSPATSGADLHTMLQAERKVVENIQRSNPETSTELSWEARRAQWLASGDKKNLNRRREQGKLVHLDNYHPDMYLEIYRNLVVKGRVLRKGLNMEDAFKVIHKGWAADGMYDRIANGGAP